MNEPRTPKPMNNGIWNMGHGKPDKKSRWEFQKPDGRKKVATPEMTTIKRRSGGLYQLGTFQPAPLDDVKEFARMKGINILKMGAVKMKLV